MDPITIITVSAGFAASCVAQKCADAAIEKAWKKIQYRLESVLGRDPEPADLAKSADKLRKSLPDDQFDTVI